MEPLWRKLRRSWASAAEPPRHVLKADPQQLAPWAPASSTRVYRGPRGYCQISGYRGTTIRPLVSSFDHGPKVRRECPPSLQASRPFVSRGPRQGVTLGRWQCANRPLERSSTPSHPLLSRGPTITRRNIPCDSDARTPVRADEDRAALQDSVAKDFLLRV